MIEFKSFLHDGKISAMEDKGVAEQKSLLRKQVKTQRKSREYNTQDAAALNVHLAELCLTHGASRIACYLSFGEEPDTELFIDWAIENSIEVLLPVSNRDGHLDWVVFDGTTSPGLFGFAEPVGKIVAPVDVDLAIIPALAIDRAGMRLGRGKGFYDRALKVFEPRPPAIAVVFDNELIDRIPDEPHDQAVDAAVTPSGVSYFTDRLK